MASYATLTGAAEGLRPLSDQRRRFRVSRILIAGVMAGVVLGACGEDLSAEEHRNTEPSSDLVVLVFGEGRRPLEGARVHAEPWDLDAVTDAEGTVRFLDLLILGRCVMGSVIVEATGYGKYTWNNVFVQGGPGIGATQELGIELERRPFTRTDEKVSFCATSLATDPRKK